MATHRALRKIIATIASHKIAQSKSPPEIQEPLENFRGDYPEDRPTAFVMMSFEKSPEKLKIWTAIKKALQEVNITALRADTKDYHPNLNENILTYIYGCTFGVVVFERIASEITNPNVIFELGYAVAIGKPVCVLKDKSIKSLPTDLLGRLYTEFDTHDPAHTIPVVLKKWLKDHDFPHYHLREMNFDQPKEAKLDPNELDFYILNVNAGQHFSIDGSVETSGTRIEIYSPRGSRVLPPTVHQGVFDRPYVGNRYYGGIWNIEATEAGPYVICVSGGVGRYKITATEGAHGVNEGTINVGHSKTGRLQRLDFNRWIVDLTSAVGSQVNIQLQTKTRGTLLELFDPKNDIVDDNEAQKTTRNECTANISYEVEAPGKYMISLVRSRGPYTLTVTKEGKARKKR